MKSKTEHPKPPEISPEKLKMMRGVDIAEKGLIRYVRPYTWIVKDKYTVNRIGVDPDTNTAEYDCSCSDFQYRGFDEKTLKYVNCKHIIAVTHYLRSSDSKLT